MRVFKSDEFISDSEVLCIKVKRARNNYPTHTHDFIEIIYVGEGECVQIIDGKSYEVRRGDMLFINYGSTHSFETASEFAYIEIFFSPKLLENSAITASNALALLALSSFDSMRGEENGGKISFAGDERKEVEFILSSMLSEQEKYKDGVTSAKTVLENYLNIILVKMLREASNADETIAEDIWHSLKTYIDEHPEEKMTLNTLASKSFYNPSYLSRAFKQKFGLSPMEYVRERRIEMAMSLLDDTNLSVDDIIDKVGFSDRSAFYHAFSKKTDLTPAEYREKNKR